MVWFLIWIITWLASFLLYSRRYTANSRFYGFSFVQFFYLIITIPITALSLINIGLEVVKYPEVTNISLSTEFLLSCYILSIITGVIGGSIHSASTSLAVQLKKHTFLNAYSINEEFHGPVSHELIFLSTAAITLFIGLLGVNHPANFVINPAYPLYAGMVIGTLNALTVVRSTHVGLSLISSFLTFSMLTLVVSVSSLDLKNYPYVIFALTNAFFIFIILVISILLYFKFKRASKIMIKILFPKGHPAREEFSVI